MDALPLHPNAPRLITVAVSVALVALGVVIALPVPAAVDLLAPLSDVLSTFGLGLDSTTGQLAMLAGTGVLTAGCLVPGL